MSGYLQTVQERCSCPHQAPAQLTTSNTRVKAAGGFVLTVSDTVSFTGCPFQLPGPKASPCVTVRWLTQSQKVRVGGVFALLDTSQGLCLSGEQAPQGPPSVVAQTRVRGL